MNNNLRPGPYCLIALTALLTIGQSAIAEEEETPPSWSISGWINEGLTFYDDGASSNVAQLSDNGTTLGSRITLSGTKAFENTGLTAGFEVIVEPLSGTPNFAGGGQVTPLLFANQDNLETFNGGDVGLLGSSVHIGGTWGKITLGLQSMPTDNIAVLADPSLTIWSGISPVFRGNGFFIRGIGAGATNTVWASFLQCLTVPGLGIGIDCNGVYRNGVRYDLPAFGPISVAVGYANDEVYDVAAKYNGKLGNLNAVFHIGFAHNANGGLNVGGTDSDMIAIQVGLMDPNSGLFGTLAYEVEEASGAAAGTGDDTDAYYLKAGIKKRFTAVGDTAIYGEIASYNDQYGTGNADGISGSEVQHFGFSVDQYFGSGLIIYGKYEQLSLDVEGNAAAQAIYGGADDLSTLTLGITFFF